MNAPGPPPANVTEGSRVCGDYTLERPIRRGALVSVYLARASSDEVARHVARVLHGVRPAEPDRAAAFRHASQIFKELRHRSIPAVAAADVEGAEPVVVTERVEARTLRALVARDPSLDPQELARLLAQVADVLDTLHRHEPSVVHRRLSLENILVSEGGKAWVEECGLAHALVEAGWTPDAVAPARLEYLTPDEARHRISVQTDIFALATIAFECLTGVTPFPADSPVSRINAVLERERPLASALRADLSRNVDAVFLRAWSTDERGALEPYATAGALAQELLRVLDTSVRPTLTPGARVRTATSTTLPYEGASMPPSPPEPHEHPDAPLEAEPLDSPPADEAQPAPAVQPPPLPSSVQTIPGITMAEPPVPAEPPEPTKPTGPTQAPRPTTDSPPRPSPTRVIAAPASTTMTTEQDRPLFHKNFGPSIVGAVAILAAAWVYVKTHAPQETTTTTPALVAATDAGSAVDPTPATTGPVLTPPATPDTGPTIQPTPTPTTVADSGPPVEPTPSSVADSGPPTPTPSATADAGHAESAADASTAARHERPPMPNMAEIQSIRTMLEPEMQDCLRGTNVSTLRVTVTYIGWNGSARVYINTPMDDPEKAVCIERAIMGKPVRHFASQSWRTTYTFRIR